MKGGKETWLVVVAQAAYDQSMSDNGRHGREFHGIISTSKKMTVAVLPCVAIGRRE